ncbi:MAG: CinA family nicotinamide mononucleotide deamidase-related protein [Pseudomonadota bacterium]
MTIGSELVLGQLVDTNAAFIASKLAEIGVGLAYHTTVGDDPERMAQVLNQALDRCQIVITTGGIGPTEDDLTREVAAKVLGRELVFRQDLMDFIEGMFQRFGYRMAPNNRRQAYIPDGAAVIHNPHGTAPSFRYEYDDRVLICLPGVPRETEALLKEEVLPFLEQKYSSGGRVWINRVLKVVGVGESNVDAQIKDIFRSSKNPTLGIQASPGEIKVRLTARAKSRAEADELLDQCEARLQEVLGDLIFGHDEETLAGVIAGLFQAQHLSLAIGEALTAGLVSAELGRLLKPGQMKGSLIFGRPMPAAEIFGQVEDLFQADVTLAVAGAPDDEGRTRLEVLVRDKNGLEQNRVLSLGGPLPRVMERSTTMALYTLLRFLRSLADK